jgi:surfeit locus 1 family protein
VINFRPLPMMTLLTLIALAVLVWLGRWQWDRFEAKSAAAEEPIAEMTVADYQPVPGSIQFMYGVRPDTREPGWRVFAPVQYGDTTVFIDADFIPEVRPPNPDEVRVPTALRFGAPISGASIRPEEPAPLTRGPDPLRRLWFAVDLDAMGRNGGLENVADYYIAAAYIGADGRATANPFALAPGADVLPPARHLGYALTWYGLALVLLVIYLAYHASVGRLRLRAPRAPEA